MDEYGIGDEERLETPVGPDLLLLGNERTIAAINGQGGPIEDRTEKARKVLDAVYCLNELAVLLGQGVVEGRVVKLFYPDDLIEVLGQQRRKYEVEVVKEKAGKLASRGRKAFESGAGVLRDRLNR